eukprot:5560782-Prymnesium_polylepis.2
MRARRRRAASDQGVMEPCVGRAGVVRARGLVACVRRPRVDDGLRRAGAPLPLGAAAAKAAAASAL